MASDVPSKWSSLILHRVNPTGKEIGRGAFGRVFEVDYEGTLCAAKEVHTLLLQHAEGSAVQKITDNFLNECQIWSTLRHPCVVQFLGSVYVSSVNAGMLLMNLTSLGVYYPIMDQYRLPVMVMEKMQHSLRQLVENYENIPLNVKVTILDEVCLRSKVPP